MTSRKGYMTLRILAACTTPALEKRSYEATVRAMARTGKGHPFVPKKRRLPWARVRHRPPMLAVTPTGARVVGFIDDEAPFPVPMGEEP